MKNLDIMEIILVIDNKYSALFKLNNLNNSVTAAGILIRKLQSKNININSKTEIQIWLYPNTKEERLYTTWIVSDILSIFNDINPFHNEWDDIDPMNMTKDDDGGFRIIPIMKSKKTLRAEQCKIKRSKLILQPKHLKSIESRMYKKPKRSIEIDVEKVLDFF